MTTDKLRIISFPVDDGGCGNYRIRQPLSAIKETTEHEVHIIDPQKDDMNEVLKAMLVADVWIFRQGAVGEKLRDMLEAVPELKKAQALRVVDIDDNIELVSPYSTHYEEWGTEEIPLKDKWLWKDGVANFDIERNKQNVQKAIDTMMMADMVTVTTERLKEYALQYNDNIEVLPNCINTTTWNKLDFKKNKTFRLGWSGGSSHYEDLYSIKEPLNKLIRDGDIEFVNTGTYFPGIFDKDNRDKVEKSAWVPFKGHCYRMMCLHLDAGITPLINVPFNHHKSPIKFLEYSAMGIPTISANVPPYSDIIEHYTNGLVYDTPEEFYKAVKALIERPDLKKKLGKNAYNLVHEEYDARKCARKWIRAYRNGIAVKQSRSKNQFEA